MKKTLSVVLALMMVFSMFATALALEPTTVYELLDQYLDFVEGQPILSYDLPITIKARRSGTSDAYKETDLTIIDSQLSSGIGVDFTATLDMGDVQDLANGGVFTSILSGNPTANAEFLRGKIATVIDVVINHPDVTITNTSEGALENDGNNIFVEREPRVIETNKVTVKFKNNDLTVSELLANKDTYLLDLTFVLENAAEYSTEGTHTLDVSMSATTTLTFDNGTTGDPSDDKEFLVSYAGNDTYTVIAQIPSSNGGGGISYNTIKFETNGGNELKNISVRRGGKAELPVPVREGYVFTGWYTDSALKTPFDKDTVINKNYTLYAAWVEDNGAAGSVHETPEMLNGEDHFAYVLGYPDGTVRPDENITRAEVTSIFFRLLKDEVREENLTSDNIFNDVNEEDWYNTAVSTMASLGIVKGRTTDEFVPNANITRAEFAAICARFDASEYSIVDKFTDIISHWAEDEIHETAAYGWIKGYEDGTFRPDKAITRAEAMTMINRVLNRVPETSEDLLADMIVWPDNSESDWYYLPVQEATNGHNYEMKNNIYEKWTEITDVTDWTKYE